MSKKVLFEGDGVKFSIEHYEDRYGLEISDQEQQEADGLYSRTIYFGLIELDDILDQIDEFVKTTEEKIRE